MTKDKSLEKILVDVPVTDIEGLVHIFTGQKPIERPVIMKRKDYDSMRSVNIITLVSVLLIGGYMANLHINEKYGSYSNYLKSIKEQIEKYPTKMFQFT